MRLPVRTKHDNSLGLVSVDMTLRQLSYAGMETMCVLFQQDLSEILQELAENAIRFRDLAKHSRTAEWRVFRP